MAVTYGETETLQELAHDGPWYLCCIVQAI